jgi:nucleotidyltransferase substrate binding protein (TIGR01987 family)
VRWIQRLDNFKRALKQLTEAVQLNQQRPLSSLEKQGVIQSFEFTHEVAWNLLKDYIEDKGGQNLIGSKDTSREAFQRGLIENGEAWMAMIASRNQTSHTYNEATAEDVFKKITLTFHPEFLVLVQKMESLIP